jgi:hypothetical protein
MAISSTSCLKRRMIRVLKAVYEKWPKVQLNIVTQLLLLCVLNYISVSKYSTGKFVDVVTGVVFALVTPINTLQLNI